jgi:hypothetical protein
MHMHAQNSFVTFLVSRHTHQSQLGIRGYNLVFDENGICGFVLLKNVFHVNQANIQPFQHSDKTFENRKGPVPEYKIVPLHNSRSPESKHITRYILQSEISVHVNNCIL